MLGDLFVQIFQRLMRFTRICDDRANEGAGGCEPGQGAKWQIHGSGHSFNRRSGDIATGCDLARDVAELRGYAMAGPKETFVVRDVRLGHARSGCFDALRDLEILGGIEAPYRTIGHALPRRVSLWRRLECFIRLVVQPDLAPKFLVRAIGFNAVVNHGADEEQCGDHDQDCDQLFWHMRMLPKSEWKSPATTSPPRRRSRSEE